MRHRLLRTLLGTPEPAAPPRHGFRRLIPTAREGILAFGLAILLLLLNDVFFFESLVVPSASMRPTILPNERVILQKFPRRQIKRFDIVVIKSQRLNQRLAKRVIALPGERITVKDGWQVFVNGKALEYSSVTSNLTLSESGDHLIQLSPSRPGPAASAAETGRVLAADEYFVMGDNRFASSDSRVIGPVKQEEIEGKLLMVWYSFDLPMHRLRTERLLRRLR